MDIILRESILRDILMANDWNYNMDEMPINSDALLDLAIASDIWHDFILYKEIKYLYKPKDAYAWRYHCKETAPPRSKL